MTATLVFQTRGESARKTNLVWYGARPRPPRAPGSPSTGPAACAEIGIAGTFVRQLKLSLRSRSVRVRMRVCVCMCGMRVDVGTLVAWLSFFGGGSEVDDGIQ